MKTVKIISALFLVLCAVWVVEDGLAVNTAKSATISDFTYSYSFGELTINGYRGGGTVLEVPLEIDGWPVVAISEKAFYDNDTLSEVIIHGGLEFRIGDYAFSNCDRLTILTLDSGGAGFIIGESAFSECDALTNVLLPIPDILHIGKDAFRDCDSLISITLSPYSETETILYDYAFADCASLATVEFPSHTGGFVRMVGVGIFSNCNALKEISKTNKEILLP